MTKVPIIYAVASIQVITLFNASEFIAIRSVRTEMDLFFADCYYYTILFA